jgi:protein-S-isoprenylcysteine O-methyltransferase Ste14
MGTENRQSAVATDPRESRPSLPDSAAPSEARATTLQEALGHAPLVLGGLGVAIVGSAPLAEAWFVACRAAYVLLVGYWLHAEAKHSALSRRHGQEAWLKFRARAEWLMVGDSIAFGALCIVTRGTIALPVPLWLTVAAGVLLIVLGVGTKAWATATLPKGVFYWRDFFVPAEHRTRTLKGPYRWISNPMYTVGYAHAYGLAVLLGSGPGLVGAALAQLAILALAALVERPHFRGIGRK